MRGLGGKDGMGGNLHLDRDLNRTSEDAMGGAEPGRRARHQINIRNMDSGHWRRWTQPANRGLVPATSFSESNDEANPKSLKNPDGSEHPMAGKKDVVWFALDRSRPMFPFAGIWTEWRGDRGTKSNPIPGPHLIYAFLTCKANEVVKPVHEKAMPVILTTVEEHDVWMRAVGRGEAVAETFAG